MQANISITYDILEKRFLNCSSWCFYSEFSLKGIVDRKFNTDIFYRVLVEFY